MFRRLFALIIVACGALAATAATAFANAPNPTSVQVLSQTTSNGSTTVTIAGTWTWDQNVPSGGQKDCNDSRIGVGYAVDWGDKTGNGPIYLNGNKNGQAIYPGDAQDNWVHSISEGMSQGNLESGSTTDNGNTLIVDGPFKSATPTVQESMTGKTADAVTNSFTADSGEQGISNSSPNHPAPTASDALDWYSNCGPTQPTGAVIDGKTIDGSNGAPASEGNTDPGSPQNGYPNGYWGPISHTYTGPGPYTICPIMYDPHGSKVGQDAGNSNQITADQNGDNSVEKNGNTTACPTEITIKGTSGISTQSSPQSVTTGTSFSDTAAVTGKDNPSGSVTFDLYNNSSCTGTPVYTDTVSTFTSQSSTSSTFQSGSYTPTTAGTYEWTASYSGDANNGAVSEGCGGGGESTSVTVPNQASLTAVKTEADPSQSGESSQSSGPITANPGDTIDYQVQVTNTGNVNLSDLTLNDTVSNGTFGNVTCSNIRGPYTDPDEGTPLTGPLAPGSVAYFTCSYVVPAGTTGNVTNTATVTGTPPGGTPVTSPPTTVTATPASIQVVKTESDASVSGEGSQSSGPIVANPGDTISYVVKATNTGDENLIDLSFTDQLSNPGTSDSTCSNAAGPFSSPSGGSFSGPLAPGQSVYYTCSYTVPVGSSGPVTNTGTVTGTPANGGNPVSGSSTVQASIGCNPSVSACFTLLKEQEIIGSGGSFQTGQLTGNVGQIVEYEIIATNISKTALVFGTLNDPECDPGTVTGGPGSGTVAPGATTTWYCSHKLTTADQSNGSVTNVAIVPAGPPGGPQTPGQSNPVITTVPPAAPPAQPPASPAAPTVQSVAACTVTTANMKRIQVHKGTEFVVSGAHITKVVFRLNGKVIKTLTKPNDKGKFMVKIAKSRLRVGSNHVTATISEPCGPQVKAAAVRRRPVIARKPVKAVGFTG